MFERFDEAATDVVAASKHECIRLRSEKVMPEHLLLALTRDTGNIAARALLTMNIKAENVSAEVERMQSTTKEPQTEPPIGFSSINWYENIPFSDQVKRTFQRAADFCLFFGRTKVAPEHILLSIIDQPDNDSLPILEELGANLTFLRRQIMSLIAKDECSQQNIMGAKPTVVNGIAEIVSRTTDGVENLQNLALASRLPLNTLPDRPGLVLMVFLAYLPDFLLTQVAYQRYLLEETLRLLDHRAGPVDKETTASIVAAAAQNLRADVRSIIEHLWTQEYRMLSKMPDEAEHEEIGSVIEDLWWTYSEEIALHEVFDEALDDYRRKHVLNLQKRKLEISHRLNKLKIRLEETLNQCFLRHSMSA